MEWSNKNAIEFLEVFKTEPCLWDMRLKEFKLRNNHKEAWLRIVEALPFPATVDELKKKKESLMGYYRIHLNKYRKSLQYPGEDSYKTSWFAFDVMQSFLKPIYDPEECPLESTPRQSQVREIEFDSDTDSQEYVNESPISMAQENPKRAKRRHSQVKQNTTHSRLANGPRPTNTAHKSAEELDEYDHFSRLIAAKIRNINDVYERETLMNTIQNLVYESLMKNKFEDQQDPLSPCSEVETKPTINVEVNQVAENQRIIIEKLSTLSAMIEQSHDSDEIRQMQIASQNAMNIPASQDTRQTQDDFIQMLDRIQTPMVSQSSDNINKLKQIQKLEDLTEFESLTSDEAFRKKVAQSCLIICSGGNGTGTNCAYRLIDILFSRRFLCECSWSGSTRSDSIKTGLRYYKNTVQFFFEVIKCWDPCWTMEDNEGFLKIILKNSTARMRGKFQRMSTKRRRKVDDKPKDANMEMEATE